MKLEKLTKKSLDVTPLKEKVKELRYSLNNRSLPKFNLRLNPVVYGVVGGVALLTLGGCSSSYNIAPNNKNVLYSLSNQNGAFQVKGVDVNNYDISRDFGSGGGYGGGRL